MIYLESLNKDVNLIVLLDINDSPLRGLRGSMRGFKPKTLNLERISEIISNFWLISSTKIGSNKST